MAAVVVTPPWRLLLDAVVPRVWSSAPVAEGLLAIVAELERLETERVGWQREVSPAVTQGAR